MTRNRRARDGTRRQAAERTALRFAGLSFLLPIVLIGGAVHASPILRIAVAPFAGEASALSVSKALTGQLALRSPQRLIAPGDFVAETVFEPRAADIRRWAYNSAVDAIVVGRVLSVQDRGKAGARVVETIVRSGHSGAELSRHDVEVASEADLDRSVEKLAVAILEGLGYVEPLAEDNAADLTPPDVSTSRLGDESREGRKSSAGLDLDLSQSGFRSDAPIEIKADEAEILNREDGRRLVFQRNVWVHQANVTLRSERLEASYRKGESEPRELIAEGGVRIVQDDRRARCDRALYLREANRLTCIGHAELVQGCDIVRGESIEFDLAGDQARVEGAASIVIHPQDGAATDCGSGGGEL